MKIGTAACGESDNYNKKLGRTISTGRAINKPIDTIKVSEKPGKDFVKWCQEYCEN